MLNRNRVVKSSFQAKFKTPSQSAISQADVKVSVSPRRPRQNKYSLFAFKKSSDGGQMFWEELRDAQLTTPRAPKEIHKNAITVDSVTQDTLTEFNDKPVQIITEKISVNALPVINNPISKYLEPSQSLLEMHPETLAIQHDVVRSKHAGDVLMLADANRGRMDPVNLATSIHRVAKLATKKGHTHLAVVKEDHRMGNLMEDIGDLVRSEKKLGQVWLSNVLWSVAKLDLEVSWLDEVFIRIMRDPESIALEQVGCNLYSLAEISKRGTKAQHLDDLKEMLIATANNRRDEVSNPHQLVSICTSLARLGRAEKLLFQSLSDSVIGKLDTLSMGDLSSVLWSFTTLRMFDSALYQKIASALETGRVNECSKRDIVDISWSLAKSRSSTSDESLTELFKYTIAPVARQHMMDYSVRELATLVWSFATADVIDVDFFNDLSHAIMPQISKLNAHDVSSIAWAFSSVNYQHSDLFGSLKDQAYRQRNNFTPLQLSRVIYGLGTGNVRDKKVLGELVSLATKKIHLLYTQNMVEILMGLSYSGMLDDLADPFLQTISTQNTNLSGRDAVQLISVLGSLQLSQPQKSILSRYSDLIKSLSEIVQTRFNCSGRWIPTGYDVIDLIKGMAELKLRNHELLEKVLIHLSTVYKSPSFTCDLFVRFLDSVTSFSPNSDEIRIVKKLLLLKEKGIQTAVEKLSNELVNRMLISHSVDIRIATDILVMYAKIGFCNADTIRLIDRMTESINQSSPTPEILVSVCASLAELQRKPDWVFEILDEKIDYSRITDGNVLIDAVWSKLAFGDDPNCIDPELIERINEWYLTSESMPGNILRAQQIACAGDKSSEFSKDMLDYGSVRTKSSSVKTRKKSISKSIDKYSTMVSFSLDQLGIKHVHEQTMLNGTCFLTAQLENGVCLDVVGVDDVLSPEGKRYTGSRIVKNILLAHSGTRVVYIPMRTIQSALESNSLVPAIADLVAPYHERAKQRVSLRQVSDVASNKAIDEILLD